MKLTMPLLSSLSAVLSILFVFPEYIDLSSENKTIRRDKLSKVTINSFVLDYLSCLEAILS